MTDTKLILALSTKLIEVLNDHRELGRRGHISAVMAVIKGFVVFDPNPASRQELLAEMRTVLDHWEAEAQEARH